MWAGPPTAHATHLALGVAVSDVKPGPAGKSCALPDEQTLSFNVLRIAWQA